MNNSISFLSKYSNLDQFQLDAFKLIDEFNTSSEPSNILVTAHTGSGKSLVAEYGIYKTNENKKRVIYTSPIKSLSNQKFYDFNNKFSIYDISIGILTGDIKYKPEADCLIMTTEILLIELLKYHKGISQYDFNDFGTIIFDEVHYINDTDRGTIWEQSIMNIPNHIQLIMLSATLSQPQIFGNWIETVQNKPTKIISTSYRVVPLYFSLYYSMTEGSLKKLPKDKQNIIQFNKLIDIYDTNTKRFDDKTYQKVLKFHEYQMKMMTRNFHIKTIVNELLHIFMSETQDVFIFPLLFFVLSKKRCIDLAKSINIIFNTPLEQSQVTQFIKSKIRDLNIDYFEKMEQYQMVVQLAIKGLGVHHSGLLPVLKEIVEMLYEQKLIKVLFATETFAVGLNMPTKTVVFCDLYKYSNDGNRLLYSHEFIQMAGRAGRRNIDTLGHIILLPQIYRQNLSNPEIVNLLSGTGQIIESKFEIDEELILKMIDSEIEKDKLIEYLSHSMLSNTNQRQIIEYGKMLDDLQGGYDKIDESYISSFQKIDYYSDLKMNGFKLSKKQDVEYKTLFNDTDLNAKYALKQKYEQEKKKLEELKLYIDSEVDNMLNILSNNDMVIVKPDNMISLTNRGVIGSFILECNPIVVTDILTDPLFELLEVEHIITLLSTITFDDHLRDSIDFNGFKYQNQMNENYRWIKLLDGIFDKYDKSSMKYLIDLFNYDYVWLLDEFIRTGNYNSKSSDEDYLFEGNFVRSVNKLLNLLNEIRDIYEKTKNYDLMNKIDIAKTMLQKDWLKPESLYLKI